MKNQKILLAAALLALGAASCQKEENVITQFTAGMEQTSAKTYLDGQLLKWVSGDQVKVYSDGANGADFDVTPRDGNATWAVLSGEIGEGDSYTAIYPAGIAASATSVTLPAVQNSADGSLAEFPMYAESTTDEFQFKNLCGALRIHLAAANCTNCTISRIKVKASSNINGTYPISVTKGIPQLGDCTNGTATTTLILDNAQSVGGNGGHDFYIYLPAGTYNGMEITFYQPDGSYCTKSGSVTVERSVCTPVEITNSLAFIPEGCISGLFSVSATKQVYFSNGNLQYVNGAWRFADHQYDCLGTYSTNAWDLFGWSTAATTYGMSTSTTSSDYSGSFKDWGTAINPDGGGNPWRTLTQAEWAYLLGTNDQRSGKWGLATITDVTFPGTSTSVTGMVLLPDSWASCPGDCSFTAGNGSIFSTNDYTAAEWAQMEAAGAVFLPAAGRRDGIDMNINVGEGGYYWSSTLNSSNAYEIYFNAYYVVVNGVISRRQGLSVRLVQDY